MKNQALILSGLLVVSLSAQAQTKNQGSTNGAPFQDLQQAINAANAATASALEAAEAALQAETAAREAADTALGTALSAEETARIAADDALGELIADSQVLIQQNAGAIAALNGELANAWDEIANTNTRIDSVIATVAANTAAIEGALALISQHSGDIADLQGDLAALAVDTVNNIATLRGEMLAIEGEIRTLIQANADSLDVLQGLVAQLRLDVDANTVAIDPLSVNVAFLLTSVAANTNSISLLQNQSATLSTQVGALQNSLSVLNTEMQALKNRVSRLESYHVDLAIGDLVGATLSGDDALSKVHWDSSYADYYTFAVAATTTVTIDMGSTHIGSDGWYGPANFFDTYLYLHQGDCQNCVIASNDDTSNLNSRITVTLQPGVYTIEATSYSGGTTGTYELRLQ